MVEVYKQSDFEEIAETYLEGSLENLNYDKKEDLPNILSSIYLKAKEMIEEETGVDVLKTSSFCSFLKEFNSLAKKHLEVRKNLQDSYNKIFENNKEVDEIIEKLYEEDTTGKRSFIRKVIRCYW